MTAPDGLSRRWGSASWTRKTGPRRLTSIDFAYASGVKWPRSSRSGVAALFTTMSRRPSSSTVRSTSTCRESSSPRWVGTPMASPPMARRACAVSSQASALRLATATRAPEATKPSAIDRPIPVPPVTIATRPVRSNSDRSWCWFMGGLSHSPPRRSGPGSRRGPGHLLPRRDVALVGGAADTRDRVDVRGFGPQRADRAPLRITDTERFELVVLHCVVVSELGDDFGIEVREQHLQTLGGGGPRAVGVRVIRLPAHVVDVELVEQLHPDPVLDEAAQDAFPEQLARPESLRLLVAHPRVVAVEGVLTPLQEVRDPPDVTFGQREAQLREAVPEVGPQQVAEREDAHRRRQVHGDRRRGIGRGRRALRGRPDVAAQHRSGVGARREQGVPRVGVDAGHAEASGVLRERDRVTALAVEAPHLFGGRLDVEQRQDPARDETLRMRAAPLVDVPVVVRLDHDEVDVAVRAGIQDLAREAGPSGKVQA